jgi:hypothetical protein
MKKLTIPFIAVLATVLTLQAPAASSSHESGRWPSSNATAPAKKPNAYGVVITKPGDCPPYAGIYIKNTHTSRTVIVEYKVTWSGGTMNPPGSYEWHESLGPGREASITCQYLEVYGWHTVEITGETVL